MKYVSRDSSLALKTNLLEVTFTGVRVQNIMWCL